MARDPRVRGGSQTGAAVTVLALALALAPGSQLSGADSTGARPKRPTVYTDNPYVAVGATRIDLREPVDRQIPAGWRHEDLDAARRAADPYRLVKFSGPVGGRQRTLLAAAGYAVVADYPYGTFLVRALPERNAADLASLDRVIWVGPFHPHFKLDPLLAGALAAGDAAALVGQQPGWGLRLVVLLHEPSGRAPAETALAAAPGFVRLLPTRGPIRLEVDPARFAAFLRAAAGLVEVSLLEPWLPDELHNDENVQDGQSGSCSDNGAEAPNTTIFNRGLTGWGARLAVADTCFDANEGWFWDEALDRLPAHETTEPWNSQAPDWAQRKFVEYYDMSASDSTIGCAGGTGCPSGSFCPDHGSHVAGTMLANCNLDAEGLATPTDPANSDGDNDGMAPGAKLIAQDLGNGGLGYLNEGGDLGELVIVAFQNTCNGSDCGIDAHNNSWGSATNTYASNSRLADAALWDLKDVVVVASAGNSGSGYNTVGSPASGKNVIAVGNAANCSVDNISSTSSRGMTSDGRLKPDVVATGTSVTSVQNDGNGTTLANGGCQELTFSGTSMASPTVVGLTGLVVQYFEDGFYPGGAANAADVLDPSGPLLKATLINAAQRMTGSGAERNNVTWPNMDQGFGYVVLDNALHFNGETRKLWVHDEPVGVDVDGVASMSFQRKVTSAAEPLKVTLSWYDVEHPGGCGSTVPCLLNDLDLTVTDASSGTTYSVTLITGTSGHVVPRTVVPAAPGVGQTTTDNGPDDLNSSEQIFLYNPTPDAVYTFTVTAANTPGGPIPFALVATGALADPCTAPTGAGSVMVTDPDACADGGVTVSWQQDVAQWNDEGIGSRSYRVHRNGTPISSGGCAGVFPYGTTSCVDDTGPNNFSVIYRVEYSSGCGSSVQTAGTPGADGIAHTVNATASAAVTCVGQSLTFTATAAPTQLGYTYQWTEDGLDILGATSKNLSVTKTAAESHVYNCRVSHPATTCVVEDPTPPSGAWTTDAPSCPQAVEEVSGLGSIPLRLQRAGALVHLTFEHIGATNYNVYVSTLPATAPFAVDPPAGKKDCDVAWTPMIGGRARVANYDVEAGIAAASPVHYILVTGDNGTPSEGTLGFTSAGAERSADSRCAR